MKKSKEEMVSEIVEALLDSMSTADAEQYIRACETREWNKLSTEEVKNEWHKIFYGE